jgi:hypothetical protein
MTSVLTGFADASAWERGVDGTIVGRARNGSWAERVRAGVPIDYLVGLEPMGAPVATETPTEEVAPAMARKTYAEEYDDWDFDSYFAPVEPRRVARARRMAAKSVAKLPKYGAKASKAHTVAARLLVEPVAPSVHMTEGVAKPVAEPAAPCVPTPVAEAVEDDMTNLLHSFHAISVIAMEWLADMADFADDVEITEEDIELERQLQRQRDYRYER